MGKRRTNAEIGRIVRARIDGIGALEAASEEEITKLFNAEFSFHYDLFLPGLQLLGYPIPLSGHSTPFRREVLEDIGAMRLCRTCQQFRAHR